MLYLGSTGRDLRAEIYRGRNPLEGIHWVGGWGGDTSYSFTRSEPQISEPIIPPF